MSDATFHEQVWAVLNEECGAAATMPHEFTHHWPKCVEYRFQGDLGFGGKVYAQGNRLWVSCYGENRTTARDSMIEKANSRLAALKRAKGE